MHLAHQELFKKLDKNGAIVVISTQYANLSPEVNRAEHTPFPLFYYPLDEIRHLDAKEFIELLKEEFPKLDTIIVGYDFHFGAKAAYDIDDLKELFQGKVTVVDEYTIDDIAIHSRVIRTLLNKGEIPKANRFLGYKYRIKGRSIKGQGLGAKQFVPTINLDVEDFLVPQEGIYITQTIISHITYNSVSFIGHRVTTDGKFAIETHILEKYDATQATNQVVLVFYEKLRDNKKFEQYEALKKQIIEDINKTKLWFERREKNR